MKTNDELISENRAFRKLVKTMAEAIDLMADSEDPLTLEEKIQLKLTTKLVKAVIEAVEESESCGIPQKRSSGSRSELEKMEPRRNLDQQKKSKPQKTTDGGMCK